MADVLAPRAAPTSTQTLESPERTLTSREIDALENDELLTAREGGRARIGASRRASSSLGVGAFGTVAEHTGAYALSVPIPLPLPLRGGPMPQLALEYSSLFTGAPSLVAAGWRLEIGQIERVSRRNGFVDFKNDQGANENAEDHFTLSIPGKSFTLVNVQGEPHVFRAKKEQTYVEAQRVLSHHRDPDSGEPEIDHWVVRLPDGTLYRFGAPGGGGSWRTPGTFRNKMWHLTSIEAVQGDQVLFDYDAYPDPDLPSERPAGTWAELPVSYPVRIRIGVAPDARDWDAEVLFHYADEPAPSPVEGYHFLGVKHTGRRVPPSSPRDGFAAILWRRIEAVEVRYRDEEGAFRTLSRIEIEASRVGRTYRVDRIHTRSFTDGAEDPGTAMPPHEFSYLPPRPHDNRALMRRVRYPVGLVHEMEYVHAPAADPRPRNMRRFFLVSALTEVAGEERWRRTMDYEGGLFLQSGSEMRGHARVTVTDRESGLRRVSEFEQNGVHNGSLRREQSFDTRGGLISEVENDWRALDYHGGRFFCFIARALQRRYAEDGATVLSTVVTRVPETPGRGAGFAIDDYGNILAQEELVYAGPDETPASLVLRKRTETAYLNLRHGDRRFIGLVQQRRKYAADGDRTEALADWVENAYDPATGLLMVATMHLDRSDRTRVLRKRLERHPVTGKLTRTVLDDGARAVEKERIEYYEEGPYRFLPRRTINAVGQAVETMSYDLRFRSAKRVVEANGTESHSTYDGRGRITSEIFTVHRDSPRLAEAGARTSVRYVYTMTAAERSIETINVHTGTTVKKFYDELDREVRSLTSHSAGRTVERTQAYDHATRKVARVAEPCFVGETPPAHGRFEYDDPRLRMSRQVDPGAGETIFRYEGFRTVREHRISLPQEQGGMRVLATTRGEVETDAAGRTVASSEGNGRESLFNLRFAYDAEGRLAAARDSLGTLVHESHYGDRLDDRERMVMNVDLGTSEMEYDALGRITRTRSDFAATGDRVVTLAYDDLDRPFHQREEDTGTGGSRTLRFEYDTAPNGVGMVALRELREENALGSYVERMRHEYDDWGLGRGYTQEFEISYPSLGLERRLETGKQVVHDGEKGGRLERVTFPTVDGIHGGVVDYRYDDASGLLLEVSYDGRPVWTADPAAINARGQAQEVRLGNGTVTRFDYDPADGLLRGYQVLSGPRAVLDGRLAYDSAGNLRSRRIASAWPAADPPPDGEVRWDGEYDYDDRCQLVRARETGHEEAYEYHANGSRRRFHHPTGTTEYAYEGRSPHQITALTGAHRRDLAYDGAGNVVRDENHDTAVVRALDWNAGNRLGEMRFYDAERRPLRHLAFGYGGTMRRLFRYDSLEGSFVLYADDDFEVEWRDGGRRTIVRTHIENGARRIATVIQERGREPTVVYYYRDHVHSAALLADGEGRVTYAARYTPFGSVLDEAGDNPTGLGFGGKRIDVKGFHGFSSYDNRARTYDPDLGIFLSPDPVQDRASVAFGTNRYVYVGNNPLSKTDTSGFSSDAEKKTRFFYAEKGTFHRDELVDALETIDKIADKYTHESYYKAFDPPPGGLPKTWHAFILMERDELYDRGGLASIAPLIKEVGAKEATIASCKASGSIKDAIMKDLGPTHADVKIHIVPNSHRYVEARAGITAAGGVAGQPAELVHVPANLQPGESPKLIDPTAPARGESPFTKKDVTPGPEKASYGNTGSSGGGAPPASRFGGVAGKVLKALGPLGRVVDFGMAAKDVVQGNVAALAESAAGAAVAAGATALAGAVAGAAGLGALAFTAGSLVGTGIHYVTGGYVADKAADVLVKLGADKVMDSAKDAINKAKAWFSSWW